MAALFLGHVAVSVLLLKYRTCSIVYKVDIMALLEELIKDWSTKGHDKA